MQPLSTPLAEKFSPDLTPDQMQRLGVLRHAGSQYGEGVAKDNFFGVSASLKSWPDKWHNENHPKGWFEWYQGFAQGKRGGDDDRQIKRWISFKARHLAQLKKADPSLLDLSIQPRRRQALLNWGIAPGIDKQAKEKVKKQMIEPHPLDGEKPHVVSALNKLDSSGGVILHWGTGAGKTRGFLLAAQRELAKSSTNQALIIAPASLVTNVDKEIKKHGLNIDRNRLHVYSYEKAVNMAEKLKKKKFSIVIADEAQKLRDTSTKRTRILSKIISDSDRRVLATATANYNAASDIAPILNMAAGSQVVPDDKVQFNKMFVGQKSKLRSISQVIMGHEEETEDTLKNHKYLGRVMDPHISFYDPTSDPNAADKFPGVEETHIEVPMEGHQVKVYNFLEDKIPFWLRMKIRHNLPLDKQEKSQLNSFSQGIRQVSNSYKPFVSDPENADYTPKIRTAVDNLIKAHGESKNYKSLVYSNYLGAGLEDYSKLLTEKEISHAMFTGSLNQKDKDEIVKNYNSGKVPVLLVSSSGAEGLDLKGTRKVQILEPHFNPSKIKQVMGRASRYESHTHLPEEERHVSVEHYRSVLPRTMFGMKEGPVSIDKYLSSMSNDKQKIFEEIKDVMKNSEKYK